MTTPSTPDNNRPTPDDLARLLARGRDIAGHDVTAREAFELTGAFERGDVQHVGTIVAGVENLKIARNGVPSLSLETSIYYAHTLTDIVSVARGRMLVCDLYEVPRELIFG